MESLKEILSGIPRGFVSALILNGGVIVLAYYLFWKKFKRRFQNWRIQIKERVNGKQIKYELRNALFTLLVGAIFSSVVLYLSTKGYTKIYTKISDNKILWSLLVFFVLLLIDDAWFYWFHRLLHHPAIFKYIHVVHHRSIDTNPFTSMSFHWAEAAILSFWIFPVSILIPIYAPALGLVQIWGLLNNVKSHLGYEFYPSRFHKSWLRFLTSSTHHNMHHSHFNGNYGNQFRIWDRLLGSEFSDYEAEFDKIQKRKREPVKD